MTLKQFQEAIESINQRDKYLSDLSSMFHIELFDSDLYNSVMKTEDILWHSNYSDEGVDWILWYLYEDVPKIITVDEKDIDVTDVKDFYNFLKEYAINSIN